MVDEACRDRGGRVGIIDDIAVAVAAVERVVAAATGNGVIARAAADRVGRRTTRQRVVVVGPRQVLEVGKRIATVVGTGPDIGRHIAGRTGIAERIAGARTAVQRIAATATDDRIVARATADGVGRCTARQRIVVCGTGEVLDAGDRIGCAAVQHGGHTARQMGIGDGIGFRSTVDRVAIGSTDDRVIARAALQIVRTAIAAQRIVARAAGQQVRDTVAGQRIAGIGAVMFSKPDRTSPSAWPPLAVPPSSTETAASDAE